MPYTIEWLDEGVCWNYSGIVTAHELYESNYKVYGDPRFDDLRFQIVDLLSVETFAVTPSDMKRMAYMDMAAARTNNRVRVAVVASDSLTMKLASLYSDYTKEGFWESEFFSTLGEARAWVSTR